MLLFGFLFLRGVRLLLTFSIRTDYSSKNDRFNGCSTIEGDTNGYSVLVTRESFDSAEVAMHWPVDSAEDTLPLEDEEMKLQSK